MSFERNTVCVLQILEKVKSIAKKKCLNVWQRYAIRENLDELRKHIACQKPVYT